MSEMASLELLVVSSYYPSRSYPHSGAFLVRQARLLKPHGVRCRFVVPRLLHVWPFTRWERWRRYSDPALCPPPGQEARLAPFLRPPGRAFTPYEGLLKAPSAVGVARAWHRRAPFDAVLGVDLTSNAVAALWVGKALGLPVANLAIGSDVVWRPEVDDRLRRGLEAVIRSSDLIFGVSRHLCERVEAIAGPGQPVQLVYLGRESKSAMDGASREALRSALGFASDDVVTVYGGRMTREKGLEDLRAAAPSLLERFPRWQLVCLGDGPLRDSIAALSGERVRCPGWVAPEEFERYLWASDLVVFPSHTEGMPQTVLEAMDRGRPVVATRVGGIPEAVIDGETGLLVEPGAPDQLEIALARYIESPGLRQRSGREAKQRAATVFDPEAHARIMAERLQSLVASRMDRRLSGRVRPAR